jgi:hypothetical protein
MSAPCPDMERAMWVPCLDLERVLWFPASVMCSLLFLGLVCVNNNLMDIGLDNINLFCPFTSGNLHYKVLTTSIHVLL